MSDEQTPEQVDDTETVEDAEWCELITLVLTLARIQREILLDLCVVNPELDTRLRDLDEALAPFGDL